MTRILKEYPIIQLQLSRSCKKVYLLRGPLGDLGARAHHRAGVDEHDHPSESGRMQPLKRVDPERHTLPL